MLEELALAKFSLAACVNAVQASLVQFVFKREMAFTARHLAVCPNANANAIHTFHSEWN